MKLAREILEALHSGDDLFDMEFSGAVEIIAAHLEPVRGEVCNLKNIADEAHWDFDSGDRGLALMGINRLLALLDTSVPVTADEGDTE